MVETELVVKIASGGAAQTVRDVAKVQEALAQMGKSAKDTAALAKALGNAFNLDPSEVEELAEALQQASKETEQLAERTRTLDEVFTGFLRRVGEQGFDLAINGLQAMGSAIVNVAGAALDEAKAFDDARAAASTLVNDTDALIVALEGAQSRLGNQVSTTELLAASYDILSSGFTDAADAATIAEASARGAMAGFSDVATTSDALTTIINSYGQLGMTAADAEKIVDQLVKTQDLGKITLGQYADQIGRAASIAATAGVTFEEFSAGVATATAKGVPAESAVSGMRQAIVNLLKPTAEGTKLLAQFGIENSTAALRSEGLIGVLEVLRDQGATTDQLSKIFSDVDALATVATLAGENLGSFQTNLEGITEATGTTDKNMQALTQTVTGQETAIRNLTKEGFLELGRAIEPIKIGVLAFANSLITATTEGSEGLGELRSASERFQTVLANNPDIVDRLAKALATLADTGVQQLSLLLDGITAFVAEKDNIDQIGQSLESVAVVITRLGQTARFIVALADGILTLKTRLDELPPAAEGFKQALDVTGATKGFQILGGVVELLNQTFLVLNATVDSTKNFIQNLVERFDFLGNNPVVKALIGQILETETAAVGLGTALSRSATTGAAAMDDLGKAADAAAKSAQDAKDASTPPPPPPPGETVSPLAGLVEANRAALDTITTDNDNARAALLENGETQAQVAALERKALEDRVAQNRTYLQELKDLQSAGGLSAEDAQQLADAIRDVEGQLASDRVRLAQQVVNAQRDAAKAAEDAAKESAKAQQEAVEAAAKAQADALKETRDEAKRLAEEAFGETQREEGVIFSEAQAAKAEAFQTSQQADQEAFNKAQDEKAKAAQEELQAEQEAFDEAQNAADKAFQKEQQAEAKAFQASQQAAAKAFQKQLDAERDKGGREFDVLTSEVERRIQLQQAAGKAERAELEAQFAEEDRLLKERRKVEQEVLRERGSVLAERREETLLGPLEQARADFEEQLQAKAEAFQEAQRIEAEAFEIQQQETAAAFEEGQRLAQVAFDDQQQAKAEAFNLAMQEADKAFQEAQQTAEKAFSDAQKEADRAFQAEQQAEERAFKEQQRQLDKANAEAIARILEAAKPRGIDGARRDGGPVRSGGTYLVGEDGPELVTPRRGGYVYTAQQTAALMAGLPTMRGVSVPALGSTAKLEGLMGDLLQEVRKGRQVRPQSTYNLTTAAPVQDAMALQLAEIRALMDRRGL